MPVSHRFSNMRLGSAGPRKPTKKVKFSDYDEIINIPGRERSNTAPSSRHQDSSRPEYPRAGAGKYEHRPRRSVKPPPMTARGSSRSGHAVDSSSRSGGGDVTRSASRASREDTTRSSSRAPRGDVERIHKIVYDGFGNAYRFYKDVRFDTKGSSGATSTSRPPPPGAPKSQARSSSHREDYAPLRSSSRAAGAESRRKAVPATPIGRPSSSGGRLTRRKSICGEREYLGFGSWSVEELYLRGF